MRLLVTGSGRSGTRWFAEQLRAAGLDCHHETAFDHVRHGEGPWSAEVSWLAGPYTPMRDTYVVNLVRHPLAAVRSRAMGSGGWGLNASDETTRAHFAFARWWVAMPTHSPLEAAALHWAGWNRLIRADEMLRVEHVTAGDVERLACLVDPDAWLNHLTPPTNAHTEDWPELDWSDIDVPGLRELAEEYGYS